MGLFRRLMKRFRKNGEQAPIPVSQSGTPEGGAGAQTAFTNVRLRFEVDAQTHWGDRIVLVGDVPELGSWDPARGVELQGDDYPTWTASVLLPPGAAVEYKYVRRSGDGQAEWELGHNRAVSVPDAGAVEQHDRFRS